MIPVCNTGRPQQAVGKPFSRFLRALAIRQDPARQGTDLLHCNQVLSSAPNHAQKKAWSNEHDEQRNPAIRAIGV